MLRHDPSLPILPAAAACSSRAAQHGEIAPDAQVPGRCEAKGPANRHRRELFLVDAVDTAVQSREVEFNRFKRGWRA